MKKIVIIGNGPSGSALAALLAQRGLDVTMFADGRRPDLIVGESLIPAIIPVLRRLDLEERIAAVGLYKPGVTFSFTEREEIHFCFEPVSACNLPTYAYNVPRPAFDHVIESRAVELGVRRVEHQAKIERQPDGRVHLAPETLAAAPSLDGRQPDFVVDASGRSRYFARALGIKSEVGNRRDVAHFAHFEGFEPENPRGQVVISQLSAGWSWRIPLRDCLSVGIVVNRDAAARLGASPEERLETAIRTEKPLMAGAVNVRRLTDVVSYSNYQLVSETGHGPNWAMVGDAFGFVDPMLSPGMWLAFRSAELLADNLQSPAVYETEMRRLIKGWMEFIEYYYDGRMFAMYHTGTELERKYDNVFSRIMHRHIEGCIACMASGATTNSAYGRGLVKFMAKHFIHGQDPRTLAIH